MTTIWVSDEVRNKLASKKLRVGEKQSKFETYNDVIIRLLVELEKQPPTNSLLLNPNELTSSVNGFNPLLWGIIKNEY